MNINDDINSISDSIPISDIPKSSPDPDHP